MKFMIGAYGVMLHCKRLLWIRQNTSARTFTSSIVRDVRHFKFSEKKFSSCVNTTSTISPSKGEKSNHDETDIQQCDVAIIGGGMVGMALACSLGNTQLTRHLSVAIVDINPLPIMDPENITIAGPPDPRVSTVTPATISFFQDIGAWKYVERHRHAYFDKMQVWDYTGLGYTRYTAKDVDKDVLGCVVENRVLHSSLVSRFQEIGSEKEVYTTKMKSMAGIPSTRGHPCSSVLELDNGKKLQAKLVVGADGAGSRVRELAGFKTAGWSYPQEAVVCTVEHPGGSSCAWQRFLPSGPIALLPMGGDYSNVVWTTTPAEAARLRQMDEPRFVDAVNHALTRGHGPSPEPGVFGRSGLFRARPGGGPFEAPPEVSRLSSRTLAFPLAMRHADRYAAGNVVLIGDAAHTVHPLAGQGVNLGFGDALSLSTAIATGVALGSDISQEGVVRKYEKERRPRNLAMMGVLDGFQKAYSVDFGPLNLLRAAALHGANHFSPLKRLIVRFASGENPLPAFHFPGAFL